MSETLTQIIIPIATSIVAAIIFWLFFNYRPEKSRYDKLRPKLEYDIYEIFSSLFHWIEIPLRYNMNSPAHNQAEIFAGICTMEDFEIALSSKCLNDSYKIDEISSKLLAIGDKLDTLSLDICNKIQYLYAFNQHLTTQEILLLRKIAVKIRGYHYNGIASFKRGGQTFYPVNPTMSYMAQKFHELYLLLLNLQEIVFNYKKIDDTINDNVITNLSSRRVQNYCRRGEYKRCLKYARKGNEKQVWGYKFISLYKIGKEKDAINYLKQQLNDSDLRLIYERGFFDDLYKEENIKNVLIECRSEGEYKEMVDCLEAEYNYSKEMTSQAKQIRDYYNEKVMNQTQIFPQ